MQKKIYSLRRQIIRQGFIIDSAYRIREKCDYSEFFIASKADSELQLKNAKDFVNSVEDYLNYKFSDGSSREN